MFPRRQRLQREAFPQVHSKGKRFSSPHFSAISSESVNGYAVVVSKKTARLSVVRHRIKRQVLAALRTLPLPPSLILFPQASTSRMYYEDIRKELADLLSKIRH